MNHLNVAYLAKTMSRLRILAFGVISKKSTLGDYRKMIEGKKQAQDYYNKCSQYLFELVAMFCSEHGLGSADIEILFEEKRGHDYQRLAHYLGAIANKPIDSRAAKLYHLSPFIINAKNKADEPALAVADLIAYALHKSFCSENNRLRLTEQRYLREIKSNFYKHPQNSQIANHGIKFIKGPVAMGLSGEEMSFAMKFYNKSDVT